MATKMTQWQLGQGYAQIFVVRGTVSWPSQGAGELQLWYNEMRKVYRILANKKVGGGKLEKLVCELMFYAFTFNCVLTKSKRY